MEVFSKIKGKYRLQKDRATSMVRAMIPDSFYRKKMIKEMNKYRERMETEDVYYMLGRDEAIKMFTNPNVKARNMYEVFKIYQHWDEYGYLSKNTGLFFEELLADKNNYVGVHRSDSIGQFSDVLEDIVLEDVFTNGLRNGGALWKNGIVHEGFNEPKETIDPCHKILDLVMFSKGCRVYGDKVSIITSIPREYVNEAYEIINDSGPKIYNINSGDLLDLKPEFIVGFIYREKGNCTFYTKEDYMAKKK